MCIYILIYLSYIYIYIYIIYYILKCSDTHVHCSFPAVGSACQPIPLRLKLASTHRLDFEVGSGDMVISGEKHDALMASLSHGGVRHVAPKWPQSKHDWENEAENHWFFGCPTFRQTRWRYRQCIGRCFWLFRFVCARISLSHCARKLGLHGLKTMRWWFLMWLIGRSEAVDI